MNNTKKKRAVFVDRDGTIIDENGYICHFSQATIFPYAFEAIKKINQMGFIVIGITNQSSIARDICTEEEVKAIHLEICRVFQEKQARIEQFYYCPYHIEGVLPEYKKVHPWRKPQPGMLLQAAEDYHIDLSQSIMIGDNVADIEAGKNAGCKTILLLTGHGPEAKETLLQKNVIPDLITENLITALSEENLHLFF